MRWAKSAIPTTKFDSQEYYDNGLRAENIVSITWISLVLNALGQRDLLPFNSGINSQLQAQTRELDKD